MIWFWLVLLLVCSAAVSGSETALFGLNRESRHAFARSASTARRLAAHLMEQPQRLLMTVLLANNLVNVAIFALSYIAIQHQHGDSPIVSLALSAAVLISLIAFGEIVPKTLAISNPRLYAPIAAVFIGTLRTALAPPVWVLRVWVVAPLVRLLGPTSLHAGPVTSEELRMLVEQSAHEGVIDTREHDLLQAAVAAGGIKVREVMTPRVDIKAAYIGSTRRQLLEQARAGSRRRLPVYGRDLDDIRGVLFVRDLFLDERMPLRQIIRPLPFVPEQATLLQVVRYFRELKADFAVVVDEYGGTSGLCSLGDISEWIVGEIPDEGAEPSVPEFEQVDAETYRIPGNLSARLWASRFAVGLEEQFDTVAGLVLAELGRMPREGDCVRLGNLSLTVEKMRRRRIERLLLRLSDGNSKGGGR
ncbi:MAG: HlyC/CorC family transporter [Phycisphaerae bacterium]|nr:HlyC/CorC family transporter [Phycisphaerae bacterium]